MIFTINIQADCLQWSQQTETSKYLKKEYVSLLPHTVYPGKLSQQNEMSLSRVLRADKL